MTVEYSEGHKAVEPDHEHKCVRCRKKWYGFAPNCEEKILEREGVRVYIECAACKFKRIKARRVAA